MSISSRKIFMGSAITAGVLLLFLPFSFGIAFTCFGGCSSLQRGIVDTQFMATLICLVLSILVAFVSLLFYLRKLKKPIWPVLLIGAVAVGLLVFHYQLRPYLRDRSFKADFRGTIYKPTYIPSGYEPQRTSYMNDYSDSTRQGKVISTTYEKVAGIDGNGDEYYGYLLIEQKDTENPRWDIVSRCATDNKCAHIITQNGTDIYCTAHNGSRCATRLGNTYIDVSQTQSGPQELTQKDVVKILSSLQPE